MVLPARAHTGNHLEGYGGDQSDPNPAAIAFHTQSTYLAIRTPLLVRQYWCQEYVKCRKWFRGNFLALSTPSDLGELVR